MLITIAIPFFNAERYLNETIQSVFNQTYTDWKLLLIDDGSKDGSLAIAKKYESDPRVTVYSDGLNKNLGYRLNQIPNLVDTKYLARMDADDIMLPSRIEKQLEVMQFHPEIDVLGTNAYSIDENNNVVGIRLNYINNEKLADVTGFIHPTIIAKTEWFKKNLYDVSAIRLEDTELWFRTAGSFNFQILTEPLLFYREYGGDYYKKYRTSYRTMAYLLKKHKYDPKWVRFLLKYYLSGFVYLLFNIAGKEEYLIKRRNRVVFEKKKALADLKVNNNL
ncbi:MAG: glycosyltransferase family 2 protein [Spirochaetales bacterium]|jgi:glycosyltransferase involved in cell wall biosynthesis